MGALLAALPHDSRPETIRAMLLSLVFPTLPKETSLTMRAGGGGVDVVVL